MYILYELKQLQGLFHSRYCQWHRTEAKILWRLFSSETHRIRGPWTCHQNVQCTAPLSCWKYNKREFLTLTVLSYLLQSVVAEHFPYDSIIIMCNKQCLHFLAFSPRWLTCVCHMHSGWLLRGIISWGKKKCHSLVPKNTHIMTVKKYKFHSTGSMNNLISQ